MHNQQTLPDMDEWKKMVDDVYNAYAALLATVHATTTVQSKATIKLHTAVRLIRRVWLSEDDEQRGDAKWMAFSQLHSDLEILVGPAYTGEAAEEAEVTLSITMGKALHLPIFVIIMHHLRSLAQMPCQGYYLPANVPQLRSQMRDQTNTSDHSWARKLSEGLTKALTIPVPGPWNLPKSTDAIKTGYMQWGLYTWQEIYKQWCVNASVPHNTPLCVDVSVTPNGACTICGKLKTFG